MKEYLAKTEAVVDKTAEQEYIKQLGKQKFFNLCEECDIDFDAVARKKKSCNEDFHKFNFIVKKLNEHDKITMTEVATYLYTDIFKIKNVLSCFNDANMWSLRKELATKYDIKMNTSVLHHFLVKGGSK
jgi:hypothetical protein